MFKTKAMRAPLMPLANRHLPLAIICLRKNKLRELRELRAGKKKAEVQVEVEGILSTEYPAPRTYNEIH